MTEQPSRTSQRRFLVAIMAQSLRLSATAEATFSSENTMLVQLDILHSSSGMVRRLQQLLTNIPSTVYYGFVGYYPRLTSIAYNGQYALFGTSVDDGILERFFDNGTINSLSWTGTVDSMGWNGTDFLISGSGGTKLYNGAKFHYD